MLWFSAESLNLLDHYRDFKTESILNERAWWEFCIFRSWVSNSGCQTRNWLQQLIGFHVKFALPERASLSWPSSIPLLICTRPQRQTDRRTDGPAHMENNQYLFELKRGGKWIIVLTQLALGNSPKSMAAGFMCGEGLVDTAESNKQHRKTDTIKFIHTNTLSRRRQAHKHTFSTLNTHIPKQLALTFGC